MDATSGVASGCLRPRTLGSTFGKLLRMSRGFLVSPTVRPAQTTLSHCGMRGFLKLPRAV
eukprot:952618-Prorocentrum_lima.AAC.1